METKEKRLNKRAWLLHNFDYVLQEAVYYRDNKEYFSAPRLRFWKWGEEQGTCKINYVEQE